MQIEFTAIFERDGDRWVASCLEIPGTSGQGKTQEEARESLIEGVSSLLKVRREQGLHVAPADALGENIVLVGEYAVISPIAVGASEPPPDNFGRTVTRP